MSNEQLVITGLTLRNLKPSVTRFKNDQLYREHILHVISNWDSYWTQHNNNSIIEH